jgi:hypothetical protein
MAVSNVYFARSSTGAGVGVGKGVLVGNGVTVAVGINEAVGVTVGVGARDEHAESMKVSKRRAWMGLFCMGCILAKKLPLGDFQREDFQGLFNLSFDHFFHCCQRGIKACQHLLLHHVFHAWHLGHSRRGEDSVYLHNQLRASTIFFEDIGVG